MAYNAALADRIRNRLSDIPRVEEKQMMGGLVFMVNDKMCVGIMKGGDMMCRIDPALQESVLEKRGSRVMDFTGRPMNGYILVDETGMKSVKDFDFWISLCLDFNKRAKRSKKK